MSSEEAPDPFWEHKAATPFMIAAFDARDNSLSGEIPGQKCAELCAQFGLCGSETAAMAYLAKHRTGEMLAELEMEIYALEEGIEP
jgi:hypothetical protein